MYDACLCLPSVTVQIVVPEMTRYRLDVKTYSVTHSMKIDFTSQYSIHRQSL